VPRLIVVPTPIGNLEDITLRALRALREVPLILAEDTRHTRKLLSRYEITTRLMSYHQHNKRARLVIALEALETHDVALVTSAGMPAVSDPGFELIEATYQAGIDVDVLPGPSAAITAVVAAAVPAQGFLFMGFLPRRPGDRRRRLTEVSSLQYSLVLFEAPHRLLSLLHDLQSELGDRPVVIARELTKLHQEVLRSAVSEAIQRYSTEEPRGEFTLVVAPPGPSAGVPAAEALDELRARHSRGEDARTAVGEVARKYGVSRNEAYRMWLKTRDP
jgi:16S rRNA (cytidine1402-2'-O)-methyltransferase